MPGNKGRGSQAAGEAKKKKLTDTGKQREAVDDYLKGRGFKLSDLTGSNALRRASAQMGFAGARDLPEMKREAAERALEGVQSRGSHYKSGPPHGTGGGRRATGPGRPGSNRGATNPDRAPDVGDYATGRSRNVNPEYVKLHGKNTRMGSRTVRATHNTEPDGRGRYRETNQVSGEYHEPAGSSSARSNSKSVKAKHPVPTTTRRSRPRG